MPPSASPPPTGSPQSQDLPQLLENAAQQVSRVLTRQLADICGLALVEWRVLVTVGQHDGVSSSGVAELTDLDKVKVSRALSGLVILGLVRKSDDPRDGRAHLLRLTQRGRVVHQRT